MQFEDHLSALMAGADIYLPAVTPCPAVIQLHGCGGKKALQGRWAEVARRTGVAAVVVDSYAHRGISRLDAYLTVCTGAQLWGRERAGDLFAALEWTRRQTWADPSRLAVAGWSHGGWTALDALALSPGREMAAATGLAGLPSEPLAGLRGAFLLYPYLGYGSVALRAGLRFDAAPLAIVGSKDVIVGGDRLRQALSALPTPGAPVRVEWFEGATHAFDEPEAMDLRVRYSPALTARAHRLYEAYLKARLGVGIL